MFKILILAAIPFVATAQYKRLIGSPAYYGYAPEIKSGPIYGYTPDVKTQPLYGYAPEVKAQPIYATYTDNKPVYESYPETPSPYSFGYTVDDGYGNKNHQTEEGDSHGNKKGSYGYTDAYGIYRKVEYIADDHGFRASISTNEPGVGSASPADVQLYAKESPSVAPYKSPSYSAPIYAPVPKPYASYAIPRYHPQHRNY